MDDKISGQTSYNFSVAKVCSLVAVVLGHFAQVSHHPSMSVLWIPTQIGLFIFAFSSGYFTGWKYTDKFSVRRFWHAKIPRLLGPLLVLDGLLICVLVSRGCDHVFHWHSLLACFGLSGLLMVGGVENVSPLGNGLWFFTLLLGFYLVFPLLEWINRSRARGVVFVLASAVAAIGLVELIPYGVAFWETAWFFILGAYSGRNMKRPPLGPALLIAVAFGFGIPLFKFVLKAEWGLVPLMLGLGAGVVWCVTSIRLPRYGSPMVNLISGLMLEVYVLHTYFFVVGFSGSFGFDLGISFCLVFLVALIVKPASEVTGQFLGNRLRHSAGRTAVVLSGR